MNNPRTNDEFLKYVEGCQSRLFGYLYSLLHNMEDTEDVSQQAVLAMWQHFHEFDRNRSFFAWARQFAKLSAMNHLRAKKHKHVAFSEELLAVLADDRSASDNDSLFDAYHDLLLKCMDRLPSADRELLELCYFERCSIAKAAAKLDRSSQSVCNSLRRIRLALFECITASAAAEERP